MEELLEKYEELPLAARLTLVTALVIAGLWLHYGDKFSTYDQELEGLVQTESSLKSQVQQTQAKLKKLPEIESRINEINENLVTIRQYLPSNIAFDQLLAQLGQIESQTSAKVTRFAPNTPLPPHPDGYQEVPFSMELSGAFQQIMIFLDQLMQLKQVMHLKSLNFVPGNSQNPPTNTTPELKAQFEFVIYQSTTSS